jgi:hypothetical protein
VEDNSYFDLYEDRFKRLQQQGITDWIGSPDGIQKITSTIDSFLDT